MAKVKISKSTGERVPYSPEKLKRSLENVGATEEVINEINQEIKKQIYDGISTSKIYKLAYRLLKKKSKPLAARYNLKKAIMELGPSGYPFEKYIGELLSKQGYMIETGVIVDGCCVTHEVDVVAKKDDRVVYIECKYRNRQSHKSDVKVPLYINSRFEDIYQLWAKQTPNHQSIEFVGGIFTNTRFSSDAIQYGKCVGLHLIGWDYPKKGNLKDRIEHSGLYPITCLTTLTRSEKKYLLERNIVLCKDLCRNPNILYSFSNRRRHHNNILKEAHHLCDEPR